MILRASAEPPHTFYSRASVTRAAAPSARSLHSHSRTQSAPPPHLPKPQSRRVQSLSREGQSSDRLVPEAPHRPSIPVGCHQVLPDGRIALGVPAHPQPSNHSPVVSDTPFCSDCDSHIVGVFVRIKDKNLHVECFKCSTCGSSLKNQGYYNLNGKLYCDIHAKLVARQNPPAPNLEPVTVAPGGRIPTNPYTTPLPPLSTGNYTNGSSSLFSPSSNLSGPKPFGSSIGSAYSPSLSPRSAPMSPARPVVAPAHTPAPAAPLSAPFAPSSSVGAAARGKTFGVSSAPKRGRGVLNKAVLPGSRVPLCGSCNGNVRGPFITALGRIWCPEHFICVNATCRRPLQDIGFVEENGQLYCEFCFEQYIAPACDKCHAKIKEDCLNAIGKHFHPECFSCVYCGKLFGNNPFFLEDGLPYCEADWNELFTTKCFACGFPVEAGDRCAKRISKDRVSSPGEEDLSAGFTPARSPPKIVYNSDTVYSTVTFRPVSVSPSVTPFGPPQRTRKLETPLHFDGELFSDIRSTEGKLLSKVTIDHIQSSTKHDVTDSPNVSEGFGLNGKAFVDDIVKTETITNEDVIKVKFTPVQPEMDSLTTQFIKRSVTPVNYLKNDFDDLTSYKIVNSLCKEQLLQRNGAIDKLEDMRIEREHSPLANNLISEKLIKIDSYLQESLNRCSEAKDTVPHEATTETDVIKDVMETQKDDILIDNQVKFSETNPKYDAEDSSKSLQTPKENKKSKNSVDKKKLGVLGTIYKLPMHYHAAIICFLLIVYNLIYQYIKQNCYGNGATV